SRGGRTPEALPHVAILHPGLVPPGPVRPGTSLPPECGRGTMPGSGASGPDMPFSDRPEWRPCDATPSPAVHDSKDDPPRPLPLRGGGVRRVVGGSARRRPTGADDAHGDAF